LNLSKKIFFHKTTEIIELFLELLLVCQRYLLVIVRAPCYTGRGQ